MARLFDGQVAGRHPGRDSRGFNGKVWLDQLGKPSDDPVAYTRGWIVAVELVLLPDTQLMEFICLENERDTRKR